MHVEVVGIHVSSLGSEADACTTWFLQVEATVNIITKANHMLNISIVTINIQRCLLVVTSKNFESAIDVVVLKAHLLQSIRGAAALLAASKLKDSTAPLIFLHLMILVKDFLTAEEMRRWQ